jgi:hypothetical protein
MQMLVSILLSIVLGYRAKQLGRNGLKFGAGVATSLMAPLAALQAWDQVAGVHPALWWVIAAFVTCIAVMRLEKPRTEVDGKSASATQLGPMPQKIRVDEPTCSTVNSPSHKPVISPWSPESSSHFWTEKRAYFGWHKINGGFRIVYYICGFLFIISLLYRGTNYFIAKVSQSTVSESSAPSAPTLSQATSTRGDFLMLAATFGADDMARLLEAKLPVGMPIVSWADQGFGYSDRTRIFMWTDNFGNVTNVDVQQLGVRTSTGAVHPIPKFALIYHASAVKAFDTLTIASLNGPGFPVRLSFDTDSSYIELQPNSGDFFTGKISGKILRGMRTAAHLKIMHGVSADGGELAFIYDLNDFRNAVAAGLATLGKAN